MDTWTDIVVFFAGLFALDQAGSWMERRGWIQWRGVDAASAAPKVARIAPQGSNE